MAAVISNTAWQKGSRRQPYADLRKTGQEAGGPSSCFDANKSIFYYPAYNKNEILKNQIMIHTKVTAAPNISGSKSQMSSSSWDSQIMGPSALSAQMKSNWGDWLIHQRLCCHPEGPPQPEEMGWQGPHAQHSTTQLQKKKSLSRLCCRGENILWSCGHIFKSKETIKVLVTCSSFCAQPKLLQVHLSSLGVHTEICRGPLYRHRNTQAFCKVLKCW